MADFSGHLLLEAAPDDSGRTALVRQSFRAPFHLSKPYWHGAVLQAQLVNPTAGMLEGDRLELAVRVRAGGSLLVTTPSHARAFRVKGEGTVRCRQQLAVEKGGWLDWWPEPLVPHAGCDYQQETIVDLVAGANLFFCDAVGPGRAARGEVWAWRRLVLGLTIRQDGKPVLRERFDLTADQAAQLAALAGQPQAWMATCVLAGEALATISPTEIQHELHRDSNWLGLSVAAGRGVWVARIVGSDGQTLRDGIIRLRARLAQLLPGLTVELRRI